MVLPAYKCRTICPDLTIATSGHPSLPAFGPVACTEVHPQNTWCTLIAKRTFALQHGPRAGASPPATYTGLLTALATSAYGVLMVLTSVVLSLALSRVPVAGPPVGFAFLCWVDA